MKENLWKFNFSLGYTASSSLPGLFTETVGLTTTSQWEVVVIQRLAECEHEATEKKEKKERREKNSQEGNI